MKHIDWANVLVWGILLGFVAVVWILAGLGWFALVNHV